MNQSFKKVSGSELDRPIWCLASCPTIRLPRSIITTEGMNGDPVEL